MKKLLSLLCIAFIIISCKVTKVPVEIGGSKADGVVYFQIQYRAIDRVTIDWNKANSQALLRCNSWGYSGASFFGSGYQECI